MPGNKVKNDVRSVLLLTETDPSIAGTTKLVTYDKAYGHDSKCKETANVDKLDEVITVEDKVKPRYV